MQVMAIMSDSDARNIGRTDGRQQGRQKVEAWVPVGLKSDAEERTDDLGISMAEYLRQLIRDDIGGEA